MSEAVPTTNREITRVFDGMAGILELETESDFKSRAYRRGSNTIRNILSSLEEMVKDGVTLETVPGIGKVIAAKIKESLATGHVIAYERLKEIHSPLALALLGISGLGGITTKRLLKDKGVTTVPEFIAALNSGAITWLPKTEERSATTIATQLRGNALLDPEPASTWK